MAGARVLRSVDPQLPDGSSARLDALGRTLDGRLLWVQTYPGAYQEQLARCAKLRRVLRLDAEQCVLVLAGVSGAACEELSAIHGMTVTTVADLEEAVRAALCPVLSLPGERGMEEQEPVGDLIDASSPQPSAVPSGAARLVGHTDDVERLAGMLRRCGMRPRPNDLAAILPAIIAELQHSDAMPARELKAKIAEATGRSRGAVQDVLVALARGGGLVGPGGSRATGLGVPIAGVLGDRPDELVEHCLSAYRTAIAAQDPSALGSPAAEKALRALLGSPEAGI